MQIIKGMRLGKTFLDEAQVDIISLLTSEL
jgi:hypothetical protein